MKIALIGQSIIIFHFMIITISVSLANGQIRSILILKSITPSYRVNSTAPASSESRRSIDQSISRPVERHSVADPFQGSIRSVINQSNPNVQSIFFPELITPSNSRRIRRNGASRSYTMPNGRRVAQKRDFQDSNPPKTAEEMYARYDPSVSISTGVILGGLLGCIVGRVLLKCLVRCTKKQLRKTKRFGKYFPERELPPLHIAQQIAREQGIALPESLISKLVRCGPEPNLKLIANDAKSPMAVTAAAISPLIVQQQQQPPSVARSPSANELLGLIRVNIIGATPSATPNLSCKQLPALANGETSNIGSLSSVSSANGHLNGHAVKSCLVVTTATIETKPLLLSTTTSTTAVSAWSSRSKRGVPFFGNDYMNRRKAFLQSANQPKIDGRKISTSSYCLSNGTAAVLTRGSSYDQYMDT